MSVPAFLFHARSSRVAQSVLSLCTIILFVQPFPAYAQNSAVTGATTAPVNTTAGLVRGVLRPNGGAEFLGIPYAESPVGALRWRPPVPKKPWKGSRDATSFGASCVQPLLGDWNRHDAETGQEDCLFLNVITPVWPAAEPLPVMFWIHGGANAGGSGSGGLYNEGTLTAHGVLLVTINYRLSVFGFLAHPALTSESPHHASGDYGLMDQILALRWVRDNISRFGGDPDNITVFGQSAGSMDTGMLMTSPLARGLFQKAIGESGSPFAPPLATLADAEKQGEAVAAKLSPQAGAGAVANPSGAAAVAAMRKIPARELLAELGSLAKQWPGVGPAIDGWVVPRAPEESFSSGQEAPIPLLLGTTSREFNSAAPPDELRKSIERATGNLAPQFFSLYGLTGEGKGATDPDPLYGTAANQWEADSIFHCPITTEALWHAATRNHTFEYEFDHAIPGQETQGAVHSADLPYVFGFFPKSGNISGNFGEVDKRLAELMQTYWTNFAKRGDPNAVGVPIWLEVDSAQHYMIFSEDGRAVTSIGPLRGPQCDLYRNVLTTRMKERK